VRIGEIANKVSLTPKTIRFYEAEGLLPDPGRTASGYRDYGQADVERLEFVKKAKRLGLSLGEVRDILKLHDRDEPTCIHVRSMIDAKLAQIDGVLRDLGELRTQLLLLRDASGTVEDCRPSGGRICSIIEDSSLQIGDQAHSSLDGGRSRPAAGRIARRTR